MEKCLFVFSRSEWPHLQGKVQALPFAKKDARQFSRFFFGGATEEELDKQGRVLIPEHLRQYAELDRDVVIVGVSNRLEVWDKEKWETYVKEAESSYVDTAEELTDLGL
jgi:MraZ protein